MRVLSFTINESVEIFTEAVDLIGKGSIIAYPTESFYALGVSATDQTAVRRLFALKKRPADKPLPVIVGDMDTLLSIVKKVPPQAMDLIERYWPGPLTLIFEARHNIPELLTGGTGKVAVRIPGKGIALDLVKFLNMPLTATSANPSSERPAETSEEVIKYFGDKVALVIDAGKAPGGKPSTIIDVTVSPAKVLRRGSILFSDLC